MKSKKRIKKKGFHSSSVRFFAQSLEETHNTCPLCDQTSCLTCKGGGACLNFAYFSMQCYNPDDPKGGGAWHNGFPPKYAPVFLWSRVLILKAIYQKPKPARDFEGVLQHFNLQKTVYHSKLSATTSPTTVICDTTEKAYILYIKTRQFLPDLKRHFTIVGGPDIVKISSQNRAINKGRRT